jgi:hypothetical protein
VEAAGDQGDVRWVTSRYGRPWRRRREPPDGLTMRFSFTHPMSAGDHDPRLVGREGLTRLALAAEAAGFDAIGFTDHPMPGSRWLAAGGGHEINKPLGGMLNAINTIYFDRQSYLQNSLRW